MPPLPDTDLDDPVSTVSRINARIIGIRGRGPFGGFLFGFDTAVINGAVDALSDFLGFPQRCPRKGFSVSGHRLHALGAWSAGPVSNRLGRVPVMPIVPPSCSCLL